MPARSTATARRVVVVGADRPHTRAIDRAEQVGVPTFVLEVSQFADRAAWDDALADAVAEHSPDLVVLAGFMKLVGKAFMARFGERIVNTHPALSPSFPGMHAVRDALDYGVRVTGCTLFFVDEGVDTGPILAQRCVAGARRRRRGDAARTHQNRRARTARRHRRRRWPARAGPLPEERSASLEHRIV